MTEKRDFRAQEEELSRLGESFSEIECPNDLLDQAIFSGMQSAKKRQGKVKFWSKISISVAAFLLVFTMSVRFSDTFANYVSSLPGLERFVELIRYDKGLSDALENEYIQTFTNVSVEDGGLKLRIDSVIIDERQMFLFYTIETSGDHEEVWSDGITLRDEKGEEILAASSYGGEMENLQKAKTPVLHRTDFALADDFDFEELSVSFNFKEGNWERNIGTDLEGDWTVKLPIDKSKIAQSEIYDVDEVVSIEGQKIKIKRVTVYPTRVAVLVEYDKKNSKEIFAIEDLRLVNERGETRTSLSEGITSSNVSESEREFFLESNYFSSSEQLYLRFGSLRALNKNELQILVDPEREEIIRSPQDGLLKEVQRDDEGLVFILEAEPYKNILVTPAMIYDGDEDWDGIGYGQDEEGRHRIYLPYSVEKHGKGPVKINIQDYPARIQGDVNIKLP